MSQIVPSQPTPLGHQTDLPPVRMPAPTPEIEQINRIIGMINRMVQELYERSSDHDLRLVDLENAE